MNFQNIQNNKTSIILSTYNEAPVIENTLKLIFETLKDVEVIVVDDNSTDGTLKIINKFKNYNLKVYSRKERGLASAFLLGLINSDGDNFGWLDSNMGHLINKFPLMIENLKDNDIVILSRYVKEGKDQRSKMRIISSRIVNIFCQIYLSNKIKDYTSSIFIMKRSSLTNVVPIAYGHGEFFIEFLFRALNSGLKIKEIPYTQSPDVEGLSKTASSYMRFFKLGIGYLVRIFITRFRKL